MRKTPFIFSFFLVALRLWSQSGDSVTYVFSQHTFPADLEAHEKALFAR